MTDAKLKRSLSYVLAVVLGISAAVLLYFYQFFYYTDHFLPGVAIASVPVGGHDRQEAVAYLEEHLDRLYQTPVTFYYQGYRHQTTMGALCEQQDAEIIINSIWEQEQRRGLRSKILNLDGSQTIPYGPEIKYNQQILQGLTEDWNHNLGRQAINPQLEVDRVKGLMVVPGQKGQQVNLKKTLAGMPKQWTAFEPIEVPIIMETVYPSITEEDLKVMGELSSYSTRYNNAEIDRTHNLTMAASAINTRVVQPGQIFSFNRTVGNRTFEAGYRDALVIVGGKFEPGVGGGICQVSSTLYNAVLLAGLEVVERHNHALAVAYVPVGLDATVAYGLQDFRFKNTTGHPIYLRAVTGGGQLTVTVYGHLSNKMRIELSTVIDKVIPFGEDREVKPELAPEEEQLDHKGIPGYVARSYKTVYDENGEVKDQVLLATDYYKPLNKLIYTGASLEPPVVPEQTPGVEIIPPADETEPDPGNETDGLE